MMERVRRYIVIVSSFFGFSLSLSARVVVKVKGSSFLSEGSSLVGGRGKASIIVASSIPIPGVSGSTSVSSCSGEETKKETRFLPFKGVDAIDEFRRCASLSVGLVVFEEQVDPASDCAWENTESTDERLLEEREDTER